MAKFLAPSDLSRFATIRQAVGETSMPIHLLPSFCDDASAVPHPQNGSNTMSVGLDEVFTILSNRSSGFWVGYPTLSFVWLIRLMSSQTSESGTPCISSRYRL